MWEVWCAASFRRFVIAKTAFQSYRLLLVLKVLPGYPSVMLLMTTVKKINKYVTASFR